MIYGYARVRTNVQSIAAQVGDADDARGFVVHRVLALLPVTRVGPIIVAVLVGAVSSPLAAKEYRFREVTREFQREHPCPSTRKTSGGCPGYRRDHIVPLACGGPTPCRGREGHGQVGTKGLRSIAADHRRCPVSTMSMSRLPHREQTSRSRQWAYPGLGGSS